MTKDGQAAEPNFWHTTGKPEDGQCCFIINNGKPIPDVFVYRVKLDSFFVNGWRIRFNEAEAWGSFADIPPYHTA